MFEFVALANRESWNVRPNVRANPPGADGRLAREAQDRQWAPRGQGGRPRRVGC